MYFTATSSSYSFAFKTVTQSCVLFLLNWMVWQPLHSIHHLGPKLIETSQFQVKDHEYLPVDSSVHSHPETSSPAEKQHQRQAVEDCWFLFCNTSAELDYLPKQRSSLTRLDSILYNLNYTEIGLLNNVQLISEYSPRGPPLFLLQN
jgi:hypothetical protein